MLRTSPDSALVEVEHVSMASLGVATEQHREVFMRAGNAGTKELGCESIMLAGTVLALIFNKTFNPGFRVFNCSEVLAAAIAQCAMRS
ncbi:MAG: hypothetical protein ACOYNZ_19970 [Rhodoferax sp.]